jgi:hypothetical protein
MPPTPKIFVHRVGRVGRGDAQNDATQKFYAYSIVGTLDISHMCDVHLFLNKPLCCIAQPEETSSCIYGAIPAVMLDEELNHFKRSLRDVELSERHRVAQGANQNYMKTRAMASKEGATLSKTIGHVPIHPLILALGDAAGGDPNEEARRELVRAYLGSYRPKQTVFELETASKDSKAVMAEKRALHPERRERKKRVERDNNVEEEDDDEDDEDDDEHGLADSFDEEEDDSDNDSDDKGVDGVVEVKHKAAAVKPGQFMGTFKDPNFFMSMSQGDASTRTQIDGLRVRGESMGERDVIMDLMPDDEKSIRKNGLVWDRRKKKYIGANEADKRSSSVQSTTSTRRLVNEAGRKLTKEDEKMRGKVYKEWMAKTKKSLPVVGEVEARDTTERFKEANSSRGKWGWTKEKDSGASGARDEVRNPEQLKKLLKQKEKNKIKNMPKVRRLMAECFTLF